MALSLGTMGWVERTGGKLAWRDRLALVAQGVRAQLAARLGLGGALRHVDVDAILPPDSAVTREAMAICREVSEPYLVNHCVRSYFFARLLDAEQGSYDDEVLYTAFLLHDLGITDRYRLREQREACFTLAGAREADALARRHGWSDRRATLAAEAIALHLNVIVAARHGREAQLLRLGSGADVAGLGIERLPRAVVEAVVQRHPRLDLKRQLDATLRAEVAQHPDCRIAFLYRNLGFARLVERAAFAE